MSAAKKITTKQECARLIDDVDILLSTVQLQLIESRTEREAIKHREQLDMLLDERLNIMRIRDNAK